MKRRVIKKNINRFITPILTRLPRTIYGAFEVTEDRDGHLITIVKGTNHTIVNGFVRSEGCRSFPCNNMLLNIRRTGNTAKAIIDKYGDVHVRLDPEIRGRNIRIRLITE